MGPLPFFLVERLALMRFLVCKLSLCWSSFSDAPCRARPMLHANRACVESGSICAVQHFCVLHALMHAA